MEVILITPSGPKTHILSITWYVPHTGYPTQVLLVHAGGFGANPLKQHTLPALHRLSLALNGLIPSIFDLNNIFTHCLHFIGPLKVTRQFKPARGTLAECPKKIFEKHFSVMQTLQILSLRLKKKITR